MANPRVDLKLEGPFFERDPKQTFRQNVRRMLEGLSAEGQQTIRELLAAGEGTRLPIARIPSDHVSEHVVGRVRSNSGRPWALTAVVSVNNSGLSRAEGISLMAAASVVERRVHAFRSLSSGIRRSRAVLSANLTAGLE
jgi:hypothetical protein